MEHPAGVRELFGGVEKTTYTDTDVGIVHIKKSQKKQVKLIGIIYLIKYIQNSTL